MPVAYAVLCHHSPRHVGELVRALHHPDQPILLHADAKAPPALHAALRDLTGLLPNVHVVDSVLCSWGGFSLVEATLRCLGAALAMAEQRVVLAAMARRLDLQPDRPEAERNQHRNVTMIPARGATVVITRRND